MRQTQRGLALTGQDEEHDPVHNQHGPEDGDVEDLEPAAYEADCDRLGGAVPELELRESTDEWLEFLLFLCREQDGGIAVFHAFILFEGGVEFGGYEGEEEIEEVDAE